MVSQEKLWQQLLYSESESEVTEIVNNDPEMSELDNWYFLDGRPTNFNVVTNQASNGSKAIAELCTNMTDAVLMRYAQKAGIDPKSNAAPQTVYEGVAKLVTSLKGVRNGRLADADSEEELRDFANEHLQIGITGGRRRDESLCFTFIDAGEGQRPEDFKSTFLSLQTLNKADIPFVQGKFNMGSSGVLSYCGQQAYKLIISRQWKEAPDGYWGWTLLRRHPEDSRFVVQYFAPKGQIPRFKAPYVDGCKCQTLDGKGWEPDEQVRKTFGTVVKLYDYDLGQGHSAEFNRLRAELNQHLISTILPFRIIDYRQTPVSKRGKRRERGIDERQFCGLETFLATSEKDDAETPPESEDAEKREDDGDMPKKQFDVGAGGTDKLGQFRISAFPLPKPLPEWLKPIRNRRRVFHAVNGQVHYTNDRGYLSNCKFPALMDRVLIVVDATDLTERTHNDLWKGDRESIRQTKVGQEYLELVRQEISSSQALKEYNAYVARQETEKIVSESEKHLLEELIKNDPTIAELMSDGKDVKMPRRKKLIPKVQIKKYEGEYSPTFLKHKKPNIEKNGIRIPIDGVREVIFKTNARNDYFNRAQNQGRLVFLGLPDGFAHPGRNLINGQLMVRVRCPSRGVEVGNAFQIELQFGDDAMSSPLHEKIKVQIVQKQTGPQPPPGPGPEPPVPPTDPDPSGEEQKHPQTIGQLPTVHWLVDPKQPDPEELDREGVSVCKWDDPEISDLFPDFSEHDGGFVKELGDKQYVHYINFHNVYLQVILHPLRRREEKSLLLEQYRLGMLLKMMAFEKTIRKQARQVDDPKIGFPEGKDLVRRLVAAASANVILTLIRKLPELLAHNQENMDTNE